MIFIIGASDLHESYPIVYAIMLKQVCTFRQEEMVYTNMMYANMHTVNKLYCLHM